MSKDILNEFGPNSSQPQVGSASDGGKMSPKELPYSPPVGPKNKTDVGKSGVNHGCCGSQGKY